MRCGYSRGSRRGNARYVRAFLPDHLTDHLRAFLAATGQHHGKRVDEGKSRSLDGERRRRFRVEADHEVRDGVAEARCDGVCFGVLLRLAFLILCERRLSQQGHYPDRAEKSSTINRAFVMRSHGERRSSMLPNWREC
jgi:hypothetical protein